MFGAYAVALQVSSIASGAGGSRFPVGAALVFCAVTAFLIGNPAQYLAAAAGVALVTIPAGLGQLAAERRAG
jgi:hypothetical protein